MSATKLKKIVFICTGNTCRSPMAEILLRHKLVGLGVTNVKVLSAGLQTRKGDKINAYSQQVLQENAISSPPKAKEKCLRKRRLNSSSPSLLSQKCV